MWQDFYGKASVACKGQRVGRTALRLDIYSRHPPTIGWRVARVDVVEDPKRHGDEGSLTKILYRGKHALFLQEKPLNSKRADVSSYHRVFRSLRRT